MNRKTMLKLMNFAFVLLCGAILFFLLKAPKESTAKIPKDNNHIRFYAMKSKKEAEKYCSDCHAKDEINELPQSHPPSYRCLFCHKKG